MLSGSKCVAYTACIVGAGLVIVGLFPSGKSGVNLRLLESESIPVVEESHAARFVMGLDGESASASASASAKESHAARFARGPTSRSKEEVIAVNDNKVHKPDTIAKSMLMRSLKLSQKELEKQLEISPGQGEGEVEVEGAGTSAELSKRDKNKNRNRSNVTNRQNDEGKRQNSSGSRNRQSSNNEENVGDETPEVNNDTMKIKGEKSTNKRRKDTPDDAVEANMKVNLKIKKNESESNTKRDKNKKSNSNVLQARSGFESIAETLTRIQLELRSDNIKKNSKLARSDDNGSYSNPYPFRYPEIRYLPWDKLSKETQEILEDGFDYDERSWDHVSSHAIESKRFSQLKKNQQESALLLAIDENVWDCFINHYTSYRRNELKEQGLDKHFAILANILSKKWEQLSKVEMKAARKLCYFEEIWNQDTLCTL